MSLFAQKVWNIPNFHSLSTNSQSPILAVTAVNRQRQGLPVWRSRYFPTWLNLAPFKGVGAYHGSDLFLLFNAYQAAHIGNGSVVPAEHALARKLQNALLAFIEVSLIVQRLFFSNAHYYCSNLQLAWLDWVGQRTTKHIER